MVKTCLIDVVPVHQETGITQTRHERLEGAVGLLGLSRDALEGMEEIEPDGEDAARFLRGAQTDTAARQRGRSDFQGFSTK